MSYVEKYSHLFDWDILKKFWESNGNQLNHHVYENIQLEFFKEDILKSCSMNSL